MVDIFDEVEEDLRAERVKRLLNQYGWLLIVAAVAIVGGVIGWQVWSRQQTQQDAAAAAHYLAVQSALEQPAAGQSGAAKARQIALLDHLAVTAPEGYKTVARLRAAGLKAESGDVQGAVALWNAVASDAAADPLLRDLASLLASGRALDRSDPALLEARLKPLAEPDNAWSALAREQLAVLDLRQGKQQDARKMLRALSVDIDGPAGLRARAAALLVAIGP